MKLILTANAHLKLKYFTELATGEISGMAKSTVNKDKDIIVNDVIIFKQEVSSSSTNIDDEAQAQFLAELMRKDESPEEWNIWWHSHADMDVFWSGTDDTTIENHIGLQSYLISLVTNKKGKYKARLDIFPTDKSPFGKQTFCKYDLDVEIQLDKLVEKEKIKLEKIIEEAMEELETLESFENQKLKKECEKEIEKKVIEKTYNFQKRFPIYSGYNKKERKKWGWLDDEIKEEYKRETGGNYYDDIPIDEIGFTPRYNRR